MKIKAKKVTEKFEDLVKEFTFEQFYELCRIFDIDVVDRQSVKEIALEATKNNEKLDFSKVKMRRDFDNMTNELVKAYYGHNRNFRRQADKVIEKVVRANRQAKAIAVSTLEKNYNAAIDKIDEVQQFHNNNLATVDNPTGKNDPLIESPADMAAIPMEE